MAVGSGFVPASTDDQTDNVISQDLRLAFRKMDKKDSLTKMKVKKWKKEKKCFKGYFFVNNNALDQPGPEAGVSQDGKKDSLTKMKVGDFKREWIFRCVILRVK